MVNCIAVDKKIGEKTRLLLRENGLIDPRFKVKAASNKIYFPIKPGSNYNRVLSELTDCKLLQENFEFKKKSLTPSLGELLKIYFKGVDKSLLPRSYDLIGDLLLLGIKDDIWERRLEIGRIIKENMKNVRAVFAKKGVVEGEYRLRGVECIAGDCDPATTHRENGCSYHLDLTKVYFNTRLGSERLRVARKVGEGEVVTDMFSGVGPFSILIAKSKGAAVNAIDSNQDAIRYLRRNIDINKVANLVKVFHGRAEDVIQKHLTNIADRVIMNNPSRSLNYLGVACSALKDSGGIIHLYVFSGEKDVDLKIREASTKIRDHGYNARELSSIKVREIAPKRYIYVLDLSVG